MKDPFRTYIFLKTGEEMVVVSDNVEEKTMHLYPYNEDDRYDPEWCSASEYSYSDIDLSDT